MKNHSSHPLSVFRKLMLKCSQRYFMFDDDLYQKNESQGYKNEVRLVGHKSDYLEFNKRVFCSALELTLFIDIERLCPSIKAATRFTLSIRWKKRFLIKTYQSDDNYLMSPPNL